MGESFSAAVLIPHLANSGKEEEAKTIFTTAVAQGSFTSAPLVAQLISQTAELGRWEMSLSMLKTLGATQETSQLLPTSADFFRRIIDASPHWSAALYVFHLARTAEVRPDSRMVSIVIGLCDAAGVWSEATKIYDLAVKEGFMESLTLESTYQSLVRSFAAERQWEKALEALTWMTKAGDASTAAGKCELVEMCQEAGQWEAALAVGVELFDHHPELLSEKTSLSLLLACASGGRWETAFSIYKKQREDIRLSPHPLAVCAVLQSCITAERWAEALRVLSIAREDQTTTVLPPMAHRLAMKACVQSGRWSSVMQLLQTMKEDGLPHDNHSQRLGMWAAAIEGQWELSLSYLKHIPMQNRTLQDRMLIRGATRYVSPSASSIALRYLQSK
ncbi:putative mitochondrial protein [Angomonas deanei]|uniref:PPR repeat, putative n=1 Tax=Angomonas deanei TaxID=59799 RepID=A0A7G2CG28_9TRYP|nr:putative mitochondrial protein [Angomonas deanei]CAD2217977.1 PPR repeat, putative [Angomonas deanei]|eukprot:EPY40984.1 putative mitochondrial protein [Angomonas deanei]